MNEHRRQILEMLAAGKITADEAERLLAALDAQPSSGSSASTSDSKPKPKYFRVMVEARENDQGQEIPTTVNVRVPMQLLRAGVKLSNLIPPDARERVNDAMRGHGMEFDLNQVKPENLEDVIEQLSDFTIDVDHAEKDSNVKIRVFCE